MPHGRPPRAIREPRGAQSSGGLPKGRSPLEHHRAPWLPKLTSEGLFYEKLNESQGNSMELEEISVKFYEIE